MTPTSAALLGTLFAFLWPLQGGTAPTTATDAAQPEAAQVAWAIFVDDFHLDFRNTGRLRTLLRQLAAQLIREGDTVALTTSGPSNASFPFTSTRDRLDQAIKNVAGNALRADDLIGARAPGSTYELFYRTDVALSTARTLVTRLIEHADLQRKALVYISNGYYAFAPGLAPPVAPSSAATPATITATELVDARLRLATDIAGNGIELFVIDPRVIIPGNDLDSRMNPADWRHYFATTQDSLRALADAARGRALLRAEDFKDGFKQMNAIMRR